MSPEKPITPPEKVVSPGGVVYEIIPGSEDIPDTETTFGGPHYTRNGDRNTCFGPTKVRLFSFVENALG